MKVQEMLLEQLARKFPGESQAALARRAKLKPQRYNNYALGIRQMDDDAVIGCATALGLDAKALVLQHRVEAADTDRGRAFWRKMASAAAIAFVLIGASSVAPPAYAATLTGSPDYTLCEMARKLAKFVRNLFSPKLRKDSHDRLAYA